MTYLLDTSVFVTAKNDYYRPAFCPAFWEWLEWGNNTGMVYSINFVFDELRNRDDWLAAWAARFGEKMFLIPSPSAERAHDKVRAWAESKHEQYRPTAIAEFIDVADSALVAHARAHKHTVVTLERPASRAQKRVSLPDACDALEVKWCDTFEMLENEGARFVLAGR